MHITDKHRNEWPLLLDEFLASRHGQFMNESPTQHAPHGTIYAAGFAPGVMVSGDTSADGLSFEVGCTNTGAPAVRCVNTGKVWVGDFVAMVQIALRDGVAIGESSQG